MLFHDLLLQIYLDNHFSVKSIYFAILFGRNLLLLKFYLMSYLSSIMLEFDFLGGDDDYKTFWASNRRDIESVRIFANNRVGNIAWVAEKARERMKEIIFRIMTPMENHQKKDNTISGKKLINKVS